MFVTDEHEASATEIACEGIDDGEGEVNSDRRVDGIAALLENLDSGIGGVVLDRSDHGVLGTDGFFGGSWLGNCLGRRLGCERGDEGE
jgi:hypothetical protein